MKIQGTLDDSNNFVQPTKPIVLDTVGLVLVEGTLDS